MNNRDLNMKVISEELYKEMRAIYKVRNKLLEEKKYFKNELEKVNEKLLQSEKLKSDFLSNIKNEINNPLTSILGLLKNIVIKSEDQCLKSNAKLVLQEVYNLDFQMRNVFIAAEIEAGKSAPEYTRVKIDRLFTELSSSIETLYAEKDISIHYKHNVTDPFVTDANKLFVILSNLLSNAIKFSYEHSEIILSTQLDKDSNLIFTVQDFGVGIKERDKNKIFDRFRQLDMGTTKEFSGHGLGLSVAHSLVEVLGGKLKLEGKYQEGTTFQVIIPPGRLLKTDESDLSFESDVVLFDNGNAGLV